MEYCGELGNPRVVLALGDELIKSRQTTIIFLIKTLINAEKIEGISKCFGYEGCLAVDWMGRSGGLALLWKRARDLIIPNFSCNHIGAEVARKGLSWRLIGIYMVFRRELDDEMFGIFCVN